MKKNYKSIILFTAVLMGACQKADKKQSTPTAIENNLVSPSEVKGLEGAWKSSCEFNYVDNKIVSSFDTKYLIKNVKSTNDSLSLDILFITNSYADTSGTCSGDLIKGTGLAILGQMELKKDPNLNTEGWILSKVHADDPSSFIKVLKDKTLSGPLKFLDSALDFKKLNTPELENQNPANFIEGQAHILTSFVDKGVLYLGSEEEGKIVVFELFKMSEEESKQLTSLDIPQLADMLKMLDNPTLDLRLENGGDPALNDD